MYVYTGMVVGLTYIGARDGAPHHERLYRHDWRHLLGQLDYGRRPDETRLAAEVEMLADVRDVDLGDVVAIGRVVAAIAIHGVRTAYAGHLNRP